MADIDNLLPLESDEEVYARMVADLPPLAGGETWNTREGSVLHGILMPFVIERRRLVAYIREAALGTFLQYAEGDLLELRSAELGITRGGATRAEVTLTISGAEGTVVPVGSQFATEGNPVTGSAGVGFVTQSEATILAAGMVQVRAVATVEGSAGNVPAGSVTIIVDAPSGVVSVTNESAASGGIDEQDDEGLRRAAIQRASVFPESGNANTYKTLAMQNSDVGVVGVDDLWDGNGTGLVVVGNAALPWCQTQTVDLLQSQFDPSVMCLAHFEGIENWVGGEYVADTPLEGQGSRRLTATTSSIASMSLDVPLNLAPWDDNDDEIWLFVRRESASNTLASVDALVIQFYAAGGASVAKAEATIPEANINGMANVTSRAHLKVKRSDFVITNGTGTFSWGAVAGITIRLKASASGTAVMVFDGLRIARDKGGFSGGLAPLGVQITVRSARALAINVAASLVLQTGVTNADVEPYISQAIQDFFRTTAPGQVIYLTDIANLIHDTPGVVSYSSVTMNLSASNIVLGPDQRPVLGTLTLN